MEKKMSNTKYVSSHEWARQEGDIIITGITDYAQDSLSDVVYVELPEVGTVFSQGDIFGVVESVKAASDLYMPMSGEIVEINELLEDEPEIVNSDPESDGWMIKFKPTKPAEWDDLLSKADYEEVIASEE
jgi:glycine cleavage system H protein